MDRKTFKEMSFFKKIEWILMYYGVTIAVVLTALFVGFIFVQSLLKPGDGYDFHMLILDDHCSKDAAVILEEELSDMTGVPIQVSAFMPSDPTQMQAFSVRLFSGDIDMIIAPEDKMQQIVSNGYLTQAQLLTADMPYYTYVPYYENEHEPDLYIGYEIESTKNEHVPEVKAFFTATAPDEE